MAPSLSDAFTLNDIVSLTIPGVGEILNETVGGEFKTMIV